MTSDEILLALRLVAMGRPAHDEVKRLAEFLAVKEAPMADYFKPEPEPLPAFPTSEQVEAAKEAKPKRAKKAD